jgi:uncharacterized protein DUF4153
MSALSERTRLALAVLGAAVGLGVAGDVLLRRTPWGLNAFLCTAGLVAATAWIARRRHRTLSEDAPWLAVTALLLGSNFVARDSDTLRAFDLIGLAITASLASLSIRGVALRGRYAWEYVAAGLTTAATAGVGVFPLLGHDVKWSELPSGGALRPARAAVVGTLLALPLLLVFIGLFASADAVFNRGVKSVLDVDFESLGSHALVIAFGATLSAGYLWGAVLRVLPAPALTDDRGPSLGIVAVGTALGLIVLLFLVFVVIQLRYLFGGAELILRTTGLTYAEYARQGFFQLVAASALVLPVLLGADWAVRNESPPRQRTFRRLAALLLALLTVVMASALMRMALYVDEFGLSEIRLNATAFMVYLAGVFAWFAWTALRAQRRRFAFGALVQGFAVLAGLHLLNPDAFIVRTNLARPAAARPFDGWYAASLSADAIPALLDALPRLDRPAQCRAAQGLLDHSAGLQRDDWRNWNLARRHASRLLRDNGARLVTLACKKAT